MKDRIFTGADVEEAVAAAAANLGLPLAELRYVVLEKGAPGERGLSPVPARIAVMLHEAHSGVGGPTGGRPPEAGRRAGRSAPGRGGEREPAPPRPATDPRAGLLDTVRAVAEAGGLSVSAELSEGEDALVVSLRGEDRDFFLEPEGRAEVLRATEHLLHRLYGAALQPHALRLDGEGFRERRDAALVAQARRLAAEVRGDGRPRTMPSLNSYERRVVHLGLADEPGIATSSSGEGSERRLTIAPAPGSQGGAPAE